MSRQPESWAKLPYAREYLMETASLKPIPESHLPYGWNEGESVGSLTDNAGSLDTHALHEALLVHSPNTQVFYFDRPDGSWQPMYWELTIGTSESPEAGYTFFFGFDTGELARYDSTGDVRIDGRLEDLLTRETYGDGQSNDVVGCGFIPNPDTEAIPNPDIVFFTKNGRLIYEAPLDVISSRDKRYLATSYLLVLSGEAGAKMFSNFGQAPFRFNIKEHFRRRFARFRGIVESLPSELLQEVLEASLQLFPEYDLGQANTPHILRLSQVCRHWRMVCSRSLYGRLTLHSVGHLERMCKVGSVFRFQSLIICEDPVSPWTPRFLTSSLILRLSSVTYWKWTSQPEIQLYNKIASRASDFIPVIIRCTFINVRELILQDCNFPTWTRFAQFIFAFPVLDRLEVKAASSCWRDRVTLDTPPPWLRFTQRLRSAHLSSIQTDANGRPCLVPYVWLFLAGRQYSSARLSIRRPGHDLTLSRQDSDVVARIITLVFDELQSGSSQPTMSFLHEALGDGHCSLSLYTGRNTIESLVLKFREHESFYQLRTIRISYREPRPTVLMQETLRAHEKLHALLGGLSNLQHCSCEIDLGPSCPDENGVPVHIQEVMMLELSHEYAEGRVRFLCDGRDMGDIGAKSVAWMLPRRPSFSLASTWEMGRMNFISWDHSQVKPGGTAIPWVKLFSDPFGAVQYIADVIYEVDPYVGKMGITLPTKLSDWRFFLAVGHYQYRTKCFKVRGDKG